MSIQKCATNRYRSLRFRLGPRPAVPVASADSGCRAAGLSRVTGRAWRPGWVYFPFPMRAPIERENSGLL
jgi:hypothetical protein